MCKLWPPRSKGQVTRSGQSRNINSAPASKFKIALWHSLVRMIWNFQATIRAWIPTKKLSRISHFRDLRSGHFGLPAPIISLWENTFSAYNFWTRYARRMKMAPICLYHHSESNDMQHDLFWPDLTSDLWSNFDLDLRSNWVSFDPSWREEHNGGKIVALDLIV